MGKVNDIVSHDYGDGGVFIVSWFDLGSGAGFVSEVEAVRAVWVAKNGVNKRITGGKVSGLTGNLWLSLATSKKFEYPTTEKEARRFRLISVVWVQKGKVVV